MKNAQNLHITIWDFRNEIYLRDTPFHVSQYVNIMTHFMLSRDCVCSVSLSKNGWSAILCRLFSHLMRTCVYSIDMINVDDCININNFIKNYSKQSAMSDGSVFLLFLFFLEIEKTIVDILFEIFQYSSWFIVFLFKFLHSLSFLRINYEPRI